MMNDNYAETQDDLNTPLIAVVGFVSVIIVFVLIIVLVVVYHGVSQSIDRERFESIDVLYPQIGKLDADQQGHLAMYDRDDQRFIPIDRAMQLVIVELSENPEAQVTGPEAVSVQPAGEAADITGPSLGGKEDEN